MDARQQDEWLLALVAAVIAAPMLSAVRRADGLHEKDQAGVVQDAVDAAVEIVGEVKGRLTPPIA